ncbi:MAG: type II secretion system protein [Verrucomicrobiota bacterium]
MTNNLPPRVVRHRGLTLLELTVVVSTLLALTAILFIGSRAWKRGSDRTVCILAMRSMQVATRSYQNLYGYSFGGHPYAENGTQDIAEHLLSKGYIEQRTYLLTRGANKCPSGGTYICPIPDVFPEEGVLYMTCSLSNSESHVPASHSSW